VTRAVRRQDRRRAAEARQGAGLWLTGALWLLFHYLLKRQGWLVAVHPLETWWLRFHAAFAFGAI